MPANDDIRDLIGRYATGSLSDTERRRLFDAALEDQDLFDQLSREHSLKQLIDTPGVRDRLLTTLSPQPAMRSPWLKNAIWASAAMFVIGMSLTAVIIMRNSARNASVIRESAKLETPVAPPATPLSSISTMPPVSNPAEPPNGSHKPSGPEEKRKPAAQPGGALADKIEPFSRDRKEADSSPKAERARPINGVESNGIATTPVVIPPPLQPQGFIAPAPPPAPSPVTTTAGGGGGGRGGAGTIGGLSGGTAAFGNGRTDTGRFQTQQSQLAQQAEQAQKQAQSPAPSQAQNQSLIQTQNQAQIQGESRAEKKDAQPRQLARAIAPPFSFQYTVEDQDVVFKFSSDGYFSLHFTPGQDTIVDSRVTAGSTRRERMPNNTTEIYITFSSKPQSTTGGIDVKTQKRADTLTDPDRTRIELMIKLY